jgi:thiosulfate dehydrogenase (quinone) large subunit
MKKIILLKLRLVMSFIFLWAFFDKLFGLGFSTAANKAWIRGGSPTSGFLAHGTQGPLAGLFQTLAGSVTVDWLFMLGLLFIGLTFLFNRFIMWGGIAGIVMMLLMYLATFPPENNPLIDEHIVYALVLAFFAVRVRRVAISTV